MGTATSLIRPISRFQRAIHLRYDLHDVATVERYIPTTSATEALKSILLSTFGDTNQRSRVLHAAYGSGKSHFAVVLAALLENQKGTRPSLKAFSHSLSDIDVQAAELTQEYLETSAHLLPVVLSGDEGDFATAVLRALSRALDEAQIDHVQLSTRFDVALETIERWKYDYPNTFAQLEDEVEQRYQTPLLNLIEGLKNHEEGVYQDFSELYTELTAGAIFEPLTESAPQIVFRDVADQLSTRTEYSGIAVIWDEFGRYLEARATQAFGGEAALLQEFAETCNHSGDQQLHFILFTHKELQSYASALPQAYQQEWSRIEGRFQRHNITTDPDVAYRLIASAIDHADKGLVHEMLDQDAADWLSEQAQYARLFGFLSRHQIFKLIYDTYPLHPLTLFSLVKLSSRVAQNERTMFTFLTSDEPLGLQGLVRKHSDFTLFDFIRPAELWDYFADAVRADIGGTGTHRFWAGVSYALDKISETDELGEQVIKSLGVLLIAADNNSVRPTTEVLSWAVGSDFETVERVLKNLQRRKVVIFREVDGYWTFISGSDVNFEEKLIQILEHSNPTLIQLRRLLERQLPAPHTVARRHNQEKAITRYFTGFYRWPDELENAPWETLISKEATDGLVVYVLAESTFDRQRAFNHIQPHERVVYVLPQQDHVLLSLKEVLRELFALQELQNDPQLKNHEDKERIRREINWLVEDATSRLARTMSSLIEPRQGHADWIIADGEIATGYQVSSTAQASKLVSEQCQAIFPKTPTINNEYLNKREPSTQQRNAARDVIDAIFSREPSSSLGLEGRGPDVLALNAVLKSPGILRENTDGQWVIGAPKHDVHLAEVWNLITGFLEECQIAPQSAVQLIEGITSPPYGLRQGVLPILIAAAMRERLMVTSLRRDRRPMDIIDGRLLNELVDQPSHFTIEVGQWDERLSRLESALKDVFERYILDNERGLQPLASLKTAMLRWLQNQPEFCRSTSQISGIAQKFRDVIRKAQMEPAKALFQDLPELIHIDARSTSAEIVKRIDRLMTEISNAYIELYRRLDNFAAQQFGLNGNMSDGLLALRTWLNSVEVQNGKPINEFRFSLRTTQELVNVIQHASESDAQFWDKASYAVEGISLRDWNDRTEERFYTRLHEAREEVERGVQELIEENENVVALSLKVTEGQTYEFRFRSSDLTTQGQRILQNFKSTMEIAGRPLSIDERRQIAVAFLIHMMGDDIEL